MTYILHGAPNSTCSQRVLVTAAMVGAELDIRSVQPSEIFSPEWTSHHPFNQMPYLEDADFELFESRAICKYIAAKANSSLLPDPKDAQAWAKFEQGCSVEQCNFDTIASGLVAELVYSRKLGHEPNLVRVQKLKSMLRKRLEGYDRLLGVQSHIGGDRLTLVDLFHLPYARVLDELGVVPEFTDGSRPNLARWWRDVSGLAAWRRVVNGEKEWKGEANGNGNGNGKIDKGKQRADVWNMDWRGVCGGP